MKILYCYLLNSLTFTTVEMYKNGKSRLKHWSGPISHLKKWESLGTNNFSKENIRDYWSTDPTISTPIFPHTESRKRSESIWQAWHVSDNSQQTQDIWPAYEYFVQKFRPVYSRKQEAMVPWWGRLKFRTYIPGKITKYGVLVRMVCEAVSGYISNMKIYSAEGKKLEDTVLSLLDRNLGQNLHIY